MIHYKLLDFFAFKLKYQITYKIYFLMSISLLMYIYHYLLRKQNKKTFKFESVLFFLNLNINDLHFILFLVVSPNK